MLTGFLAGADLDRALVAMPAWQRVGAIEWAMFSRHADLANGLILYPFEAIGGVLLMIGAIASFRAAGNGQRATMRLLYIAVVLAITGLLLTIKAAPIMLGIRNLSDPVALKQAFYGFLFWGNLRSVFQIATFVSLVCALAALRAPSAGQNVSAK